MKDNKTPAIATTEEKTNSELIAEVNKIFSEIESDDFGRKYIPIENEMWRDGYANGYIVGAKRTQPDTELIKFDEVLDLFDYGINYTKNDIIKIINERIK